MLDVMSRSISSQDFATAVQPILADSLVITDPEGLVEGTVQIPTATGPIPGYRAAPAAGKNWPIVLLIQEIFGVHEHIRDVARRLAKLGYLAVAPELYFRHGDVKKLPSVDAIREIVGKVPDSEVLADLDASFAFAREQGGDGDRLGVTGFCWGGRVTWLYAAHQPRVKAGVAWYGRLQGEPTALQTRFPIDVLGELKGPVLGLYGAEDQGIPLETVERAQSELTRLGGASRIHVYPGAPHAFYADYRPSYRKQAADDGFQRLQRWFRDHGV